MAAQNDALSVTTRQATTFSSQNSQATRAVLICRRARTSTGFITGSQPFRTDDMLCLRDVSDDINDALFDVRADNEAAVECHHVKKHRALLAVLGTTSVSNDV